MLKPLVTIIIPVYNVEDYLKKCVESVLNQTYTNIEIILIDDGSTDGSGRMCDELKGRDSRIRVIHKANEGLSEARNTGINMANGKYISFVDSDDFLHPEFIENLYNNIYESKAEVSICGFIKGTKSRFPKKVGKNTYKIFEREEMLNQWHGQYRHIETPAWNKLYLTKLFIDGEIRYPKGMNHEDVQTTHLLIAAGNKVVITERKLYYYFQRNGSITNSVLTEKRIYDLLESQDQRLLFFKGHNYMSAYERLKIELQKYLMLLYCLNDEKGLSEKRYDFISIFLDNYAEVQKFDELGILNRLMFAFFKKQHKMAKFIVLKCVDFICK